MLMALGPFRFKIPTYSVETVSRKLSSRVQSNEVIGARPTTHLLGPAEETLSFQSEFYPYHLNGAGLAQLEGMRATVVAQTPMMLISVGGLVFGRWVITDLSDEQTIFDSLGRAQKVSVDMSLTRYVPRGLGMAVGLF